ncbi:hypothetical protein ACLB2K_062800 [Fragaria x ananassa]
MRKGNETKKLIVVDFTASWCGPVPCCVIAPILAELAKKTPYVTFLKVDVDELNKVAEDSVVEAMPTFMFLKSNSYTKSNFNEKKKKPSTPASL